MLAFADYLVLSHPIPLPFKSCCRRCSLGLVPAFADFLALNHPNNRVHTIRICRTLVEQRALTSEQTQQHELVPKAQSCSALAFLSSRP